MANRQQRRRTAKKPTIRPTEADYHKANAQLYLALSTIAKMETNIQNASDFALIAGELNHDQLIMFLYMALGGTPE